MAYIVINAWYPSHKADEVGKRYEEVMKNYPPDNTLGTTVIPGAVRATKDGIETMVIVEVKPGKFDEASIYISKAMASYADIEGYEYSIVVWATLPEVMQIAE
ncbi:MAG: hypothetical protein HWN66_10710 [Candidatus Helarchaeota archaeon]|nr:hypothetical protein [Candidatus Helarchaeota archaeon]